ncbi:hypothetical protein SAY86_013325 [Trapa natans]|uniref:Uncharacterized protein n=1 Tax=Trapa natans TaxID=22666 RepID=A0AAN7RCH0_TRANT|nr:hypothetical protein SAY86_013325 [Trapa natans]
MPPPWGPPPPGPPGGPFGFLCDGICRLISAWFVPVSEHYFSYMVPMCFAAAAFSRAAVGLCSVAQEARLWAHHGSNQNREK